MWLDLIVILIVGLFAFLGFRNGFLYTFFRAFGWIIAIIAAVFASSPFVDLIKGYTTIYDSYYDRVYEICANFVSKYTGGIPGSVPGAFGSGLDEIADSATETAANTIADSSFNVIIFLFLVLAIKLILFLITMAFSRKYHDGFAGGVDGIGGLIAGIVQGGVIVLLLLAFIMPVAFVISPDFYNTINNAMSSSLFTEAIYTNNPILSFVNGFIPEQFLPANWIDPNDYDYDMKEWERLV